METASKSTKRKIVAGLGVATYLLWTLGWLWVCLLYIELFFTTPVGKIIKPDPLPVDLAGSHEPFSGGFVLPVFVQVTVAIIGGAAITIGVLYVIFKVYTPGIRRVSEDTVEKVAAVTTKHIITHHTLPEERRVSLNNRIIFWLKLSFSLLPLAVVSGVAHSSPMLPRELAQAGSLFLTVLAVLFILVQHLLIYRWRLIGK